MTAELARRGLVLGLLAAGAGVSAAPAATVWTWRSFRAADGTVILYQHGGQGPAVVVVHGAFDGPQQWRPVAERLAGRFSFFLLARRTWMGPPAAAAGDVYGLERADIAQLLRIAGPGAIRTCWKW